MDAKEKSGWRGRLWRSCVYSAVAVVVSTIIVIVLASLEGPAGAQQRGSSGIDIATYVFGSPLATGWFIVVMVFGDWRAVHQGQIALVPFFSVVVDTIMIFLVWEFWHRKTSKELNSTGTLGLNG